MRVTQPEKVSDRRRRYRLLAVGDYVTELILEACKRLDITQSQLGADIGVHTTKLAEYRNGRTHPSPENRKRLVQGLQADEKELLARELADKIYYAAESMNVGKRVILHAIEILRERLPSKR